MSKRLDNLMTFTSSDEGNARRLAYWSSDILKYLVDSDNWIVWTGKLWEKDNGSLASQVYLEMIKEYIKAAAEIDNKNKHPFASFKSSACGAALSYARGLPEFRVNLDFFNKDKNILNCQNGVIDLHTGEFREHRKSDFSTKISGVEFRPGAEAPRWNQFLREIFDYEQTIEYVQRAMGYSLTGSTSEQCLFILQGGGANGKTTLLETIAHVFGSYSMQAASASFTEQKTLGVRNDIANMAGSRLVTASEFDRAQNMSEAMVKQLTGKDRVRARFLYREEFEFVPEFKLWLACNDIPNIRGTDDGIWRRIKIIPFEKKFTPDQQDKDLLDKLKAEGPGILNWIIEGLKKWKISGIAVPETITYAFSQYRYSMDTVKMFADKGCKVEDGTQIPGKSVYNEYSQFCKLKDIDPISMTKFGRRFKEVMPDGCYATHTRDGMRYFNLAFSDFKNPNKLYLDLE